MSALLIYSPRCQHSKKLIEFIESKPQLKQIVKYHNVNLQGIPIQYKEKIKSVPTLLTKDQKILVGNEIIQWLQSLLPSEISNMPIGGSGMALYSLTDDSTGNQNSNYFNLDSYGQSLQGALTPELEARISRNVQEAYGDGSKDR